MKTLKVTLLIVVSLFLLMVFLLPMNYLYKFIQEYMNYATEQQVSDPSTKDREKRFYRKTQRSGSRSNSNKSSQLQSSPLSKFYIKNAVRNSTSEQVSISLNGTPTSVKDILANQQNSQKNLHEEFFRTPNFKPAKECPKFQVKLLRDEISKCNRYVNHLKSSQIEAKPLDNLNNWKFNQIKQFKEKLSYQISLNLTLRKQNEGLNERLLQQEELLQNYRKQKQKQKNYMKIKASILNARVQQYEQEIQKLKRQNNQLKQTVSRLSDRQNQESIFNQFQETGYSENKNSYMINKLLSIKFSLENEINHIKIKHNTELFTLKQEMKLAKEAKQKEYKILKNKFLAYLHRYKSNITHSSPSNSLKVPKVKSEHSDQNSLNFSISEDNESSEFSAL